MISFACASGLQWNRRAFLGMALAAVGLGTFWSVTVAGQGLARLQLEKELIVQYGEAKRDVAEAEAAQRAKSAFGYVQTKAYLFHFCSSR